MFYNRTFLIGLLSFMLTTSMLAQQAEPVLLNIDKERISVSEFEHIFKKNFDLLIDKSQQEVDNYLELFINFKLKIQAARALGLDTLASYKEELAKYREQLTEPYLKDDKLVQQLVLEAYKRLELDINASHLLIEVSPLASPNDTLAAFAKINELRNRILSGEAFEAVALEYSQDPSVKENRGDLGYFTAFNMVYPFETACYTTAVGEISKPFRTQFGYHIVKINDKLPTKGEVEVAHIMFPLTTQESSVNEVYQKILSGEAFELLARQYSVDQNTAHNGGKLAKFRMGRLVKAFEDVAFNLKENQVSKPFKTVYGWHIVKHIKNHPLKSLEELQAELTVKVQNDQRSEIIATTLATKLLSKYSYTENKQLLSKLTELDNIQDGEVLFSIDDNPINVKEFKGFLNQHPKKSIDDNFISFRNKQLIDYYKNNLEKENADFAAIMKEYEEGLLLFEVLQRKIWDQSTVDTLGLKSFYEERIQDYQWKKRVKATIVSADDELSIQNVKEYLNSGHLIENIKKDFTKNNYNVAIKSGIFEEESLHLPSNFEIKNGAIASYFSDGSYKLILVNEILKPSTKTFEEAKGSLMNDYQQYLDSKWIADLRKEYKVKINQKELKKLRQKYQ
ncbi:MAG: peptidylprolyl isomerase [Bacteroidetes bacterium]|nr:peptidylprolyl isomerase [Bacteroidota bacterium]